MSTESSENMTETVVLEDVTEAQELVIRMFMNTGAYEDRKRVAEFIEYYSSRVEGLEPGTWIRDEITLSVTDFLRLLYSGKSRLEELPNGKE